MGRFVHDRQIGLTERVSVDSEGTQANGDSATGSVEGATPLAISADGRFVAFPSNATNLVAADTNVCGTPPNTDNCPDVFVHDRETGATERVSVDSLGNEANGASAVPAISANGRYVAFISSATNLAEGDTYPNFDIFVHDRATGTTERVSVTSAGNETHHNSWGPTISGDGRYVVFDSWAPDLVTPATSNRPHLFVRDRVNGTTELLPVGSETYAPAISANGGFIAFGTQRSLVPEDTNWAPDVYLADLATGAVELVSLTMNCEATGSGLGPSVSADGRFVAFRDGSSALVPGDTNYADDTFVRDRCPDGSCVSPPRRVVLFIKGTPSKANCTIDGWSGIRDTLKTGLGMTDSDFLEYDYTSGDAAAQGCGPNDQFAQYTTPPDSCWSLNEAQGADSCLSGKPGQGERLASYLNTYLEANPNVNLSIVGHSQGGLLAVYTLREFASQYPSLSRIGPVVTLDSPLKGINIFSPKVLRTSWQGCGSLDYCYDSAYDMHPVSEVVSVVKSANPAGWPQVFTVDETGKDGDCPACIEVVDSKHSTVDWAADRFSVFTGNHGNTIWNWDGTGDPIGVPMLKRFVACAIGGLRPADTCHDYADDLPLNIDLYETVRQPYLLQDNNQLFNIRLDKGDLNLQAPQAQYAFAAAEAMTPTVTMRLISPSDRIIDAGTSAADVTHSSGDSFEQFDIADPEAGEWTVELYGADVPPDGADVYLSMVAVPNASVDQDRDGVRDSEDNCPYTWNATQSDADQDGIGDACDSDNDNDGVLNASDNCEFLANPDQADVNQNGFGDACDPDLRDLDNDSVLDGVDNCLFDPNPDQADTNGNGIGDVCEEAAAPVGGIAEYPQLEPPAVVTEGDAGTHRNLAVFAVAAGVVLFAAGGWCARRRWLRL